MSKNDQNKGPAPQEQPQPEQFVTKEQFDQVVARLDALLKEKSAQPAPVPAAATGTVEMMAMMKDLADAVALLKREPAKAEAPITRADEKEEMPGPEDVSPEGFTFWTRSLNHRLKDLRIGPFAQKLPFGLKEIHFESFLKPFAIRNSNGGNPHIITLCKFKTHSISLAALLRKDVRYRSVFYEDVKFFAEQPKGGEWDLAKQKHVGILRSFEHDQHKVLAEAAKEGVPYSAMDHMDAIIDRIATSRANKEVQQELAAIASHQEERKRELAAAAQ